jgi:hypothetical protein
VLILTLKHLIFLPVLPHEGLELLDLEPVLNLLARDHPEVLADLSL